MQITITKRLNKSPCNPLRPGPVSVVLQREQGPRGNASLWGDSGQAFFASG